jgi:hypothetical protein
MEILFTVAVTVGLFVALEVLWYPPSWLGWLADRAARQRARDDEQPGTAGTNVELGLFSWPFIRRRLDALAEELGRLDRDPDVFAKAFHTMAARAAYEALLADASRLADQPRHHARQTVDVELARRPTGVREELEL